MPRSLKRSDPSTLEQARDEGGGVPADDGATGPTDSLDYRLSYDNGTAAAATALTLVAVLAIQLFDDLAAHSGGSKARILPLSPLFDGIQAHPTAPHFWWVYVMLLSTMIPSLINLTIGGTALARGIPWITTFLLSWMPERRAPKAHNRPIIALLLSLQVFVGAAIGFAAQGILVYVTIWWLLPPIGLDLLDLARSVAEPDLPGQLITWVSGRV
jgi:hypothetical protein